MIVVPDLTELVWFSLFFFGGGDVFEMRLISICILCSSEIGGGRCETYLCPPFPISSKTTEPNLIMR